MTTQALVFVRRSAAYGIGHVSWAFTYGDGTFNAGSVENHHGRTIRSSPSQMGFWTLRTPDPLAPMASRRYGEYKLLTLETGDPAAAWEVVSWVGQHAYELFGRNCMDDAYDVLRAFGATNLPVPAQHWEPNHWFNSIQGESHLIDETPSPLARAGGSPAPADNVRQPVGALLDRMPNGEPHTRPPWRTPGTNAYDTLVAALTAASPMSVAPAAVALRGRGLVVRLLSLLKKRA